MYWKLLDVGLVAVVVLVALVASLTSRKKHNHIHEASNAAEEILRRAPLRSE
jgi:hypothetical protein